MALSSVKHCLPKRAGSASASSGALWAWHGATRAGWSSRPVSARRQMYSLLCTAKLNGLNPEAYLAHLFDRIADHPVNRIDELPPWHARL